jgi:hypothetical protein
MYVDALFREWLSETKGIHISATSQGQGASRLRSCEFIKANVDRGGTDTALSIANVH